MVKIDLALHSYLGYFSFSVTCKFFEFTCHQPPGSMLVLRIDMRPPFISLVDLCCHQSPKRGRLKINRTWHVLLPACVAWVLAFDVQQKSLLLMMLLHV